MQLTERASVNGPILTSGAPSIRDMDSDKAGARQCRHCDQPRSTLKKWRKIGAVPACVECYEAYIARQRALLSKRCYRCTEIRPVERFHAQASRPDGRTNYCKDCVSAINRAAYGSRFAGIRTHQLRRLYGLTPEQYDAMLSEQSGRCAICRQPERTRQGGKVRRLAVDHCHRTGAVRALLCHSCNQMLGHGHDNVDIHQAAIQYLLRYAAKERNGAA